MTVWQIIKKSFKDFYDHIFLLGGVSLIWFIIVGPLVYVGLAGFFLKMPFPVIMNLIFVGPLTLGVFYLTNQLIKYKDSGLKDFFQGFAKFFFRGMFAYWMSLLTMVILLVDLTFFINFGNRFMQYLSGIWIYLIIFFMMSQFYFWSLLVEMEDGLLKIYKRSLLLTLDNILYSLGLFLIFILLVAVGVITAGVGLAVTFIGFLGILANNATYNLLIKYGIRKEFSTPYNIA
ncbi:hypothetical protein BBF96_01800 [Anoxybacter fermentans]|uniref:DUF624 domain-containing protein n=1 Tax=Anoxybacter fermentans TaxID=1323375 RepID=A0A3S9SVG5_9FIRM|nr:hypothetical protein BBF96_01800 [Anoxybacter fermentans]